MWIQQREKDVADYFDTHSVRKLHLGAGKNRLDGWLNTDLDPDMVYLDVSKTFLFPDGSMDCIFGEHLIEHVPFDIGRNMLAECRRVLKPGGRIRITTPDLKVLADLLAASPGSTGQQYVEWICRRFLPEIEQINPCFVINNAFRCWGHQFLYDWPTLQNAAVEAGFTEIVRCQLDHTDQEFFRNVDSHGEFVNRPDLVAFETMVMEAARPQD